MGPRLGPRTGGVVLHPVLSAGDQRPPWAGHPGSAHNAGAGGWRSTSAPAWGADLSAHQPRGARNGRRARALRPERLARAPCVGVSPASAAPASAPLSAPSSAPASAPRRPRPRQRHPRQPAHPSSAAPASTRSVQVVDLLWSSTCIAEQWDMAGREEPGGSSWAAGGQPRGAVCNHAGCGQIRLVDEHSTVLWIEATMPACPVGIPAWPARWTASMPSPRPRQERSRQLRHTRPGCPPMRFGDSSPQVDGRLPIGAST